MVIVGTFVLGAIWLAYLKCDWRVISLLSLPAAISGAVAARTIVSGLSLNKPTGT